MFPTAMLPKARKRFQASVSDELMWQLCFMHYLNVCPPDAEHTGPDGETLLPVPLTIDVAVDYALAFSLVSGGTGPAGPAAYSTKSLDEVRWLVSHYHDSARGRPLGSKPMLRVVAETKAWAEA